MTTEFVIFIETDLLSLNAERKMHHYSRAEYVTGVRTKAKLKTLNWLRKQGREPMTMPVTVDVYPFQAKGAPLADVANHLPSCKAVLDGIVDAGMLPDDGPKYVKSITMHAPERATDRVGIGMVLTTKKEVPHE